MNIKYTALYLFSITTLLLSLLSLSAQAGESEDIAQRNAHQRQATEQILRSLYGGKADEVEAMLAERYIQHANGQDGAEALLAFIRKGKEKGWLGAEQAAAFNPLRTVSEGDLAATHYLDKGENKVYVDIFRFDDNGKIMEHWDVSQKNEKPNASGRTMIDGQEQPQGEASAEELEANKKQVSQLFSEFFGKANKAILEEIMTEEYLQHNPHGKDGRATLAGLLDRINEGKPLENTVHRLIADGDLVYAHVEWPNLNWASVDIFRIENGKIAEHWDVVQEIPAELPHDNGFF